MAHQKDPNWMVSGDIAGYEDIVLGDNREGGSPWFMSKGEFTHACVTLYCHVYHLASAVPPRCFGRLLSMYMCIHNSLRVYACYLRSTSISEGLQCTMHVIDCLFVSVQM